MIHDYFEGLSELQEEEHSGLVDCQHHAGLYRRHLLNLAGCDPSGRASQVALLWGRFQRCQVDARHHVHHLRHHFYVLALRTLPTQQLSRGCRSQAAHAGCILL